MHLWANEVELEGDDEGERLRRDAHLAPRRAARTTPPTTPAPVPGRRRARGGALRHFRDTCRVLPRPRRAPSAERPRFFVWREPCCTAVMNLHQSVLLVLATQVAAMGAAGCASCTGSTDASLDDQASADPVTSEADPAVVTDVGPTAATDPLPEPPAAQAEEQGAAPSEHHIWLPGYWWWDPARPSTRGLPASGRTGTLEATRRAPGADLRVPGPRAERRVHLHARLLELARHRSTSGTTATGALTATASPTCTLTGRAWGAAGAAPGGAGSATTPAGRPATSGWEFHGGVWERPVEFHAAREHRPAPRAATSG